MSDQIKHECGVVLIRLLKPIDYYKTKYGSNYWGINKLHLMMEKQRNRGQDGAGIATIKMGTEPGERYISRFRSFSQNAINDIFQEVFNPDNGESEIALSSQLLMGHLRYGTFGKNNIDSCHPFLRQNNWKTKNLVVAGNFNLTNVDELFNNLVELGQHPKEKTDTVTIMERIGHFLDEENDKLHRIYKQNGFSKIEISSMIAQSIDLVNILKESSKRWDGGYVITGMIGHGDAFVLRDPNGIRPCYVYMDEEVVVVASERAAIQTTFNVSYDKVLELPRGSALIIKKDGSVLNEQINDQRRKTSCSFERIYFSRGNDKEIYQERKNLGKNLMSGILDAVDYKLNDVVFSYIPNTSEVSFYGLVEALEDWRMKKWKEFMKEGFDRIRDKHWSSCVDDPIMDAISSPVRKEKLIIKDAKLRTFILNDDDRDDLVSHSYDVTYGSIREGVDTVVLIDDSIVRGTTLKKSIIRMVSRLKPKKIVIASCAPQIRYPDCYGIDMSKIGQLIAFQAACQLLIDKGEENKLSEIYERCKEEITKPKEEIENHVFDIYNSFTYEEVSKKISQMLKSEDIECDVDVVYQTIDGLNGAIPGHLGDWYFTGEYPTPGGNLVSCKSFINFFEKSAMRAY